MTDLDSTREQINEIDKKMAELFVLRMNAVKNVADYKRANGIRVENISREEEVIKRNAKLIENEKLKPYYINYLQYNMELSKSYQRRMLEGMKVAYSGVEGAFANIAANRIFPDANAVSYGSFKDAYNSVVNGECDCAVLPVENSYNGDVGQVMDLSFFGSLYINGVYDIEVIQNLLAIKGTSIEQIKRVISHSQALGQCSSYIRKHKFEAEEAVNTAVAASEVAKSGRHDIAAIASEEAALKYGLVKIESHINESSNNTTRFAVFSKTPKAESRNDNHFIMLFTVLNEAGALGEAVSIIGKHGFNLRALKSRPTKELIWSYYFYAEGEGNIKSEKGKAMLSELHTKCSNIKVIANFEKEILLKAD